MEPNSRLREPTVATMNVSIDDELASVALICGQQWELPEHYTFTCSPSQWGAITGLVLMGLDDTSKTMRMSVVQQMIGRPIDSCKKLTEWEAHTLIDVLKAPDVDEWILSEKGAQLIHHAELIGELKLESRNWERRELDNNQPVPDGRLQANTDADRPGSAALEPVHRKAIKPGAWPALCDMW
jgi:hypothetical protein